MIKTSIPGFFVKHAEEQDIPLILDFIRGLAKFEKLSHEVVATEEILKENLFGEKKYAEVVIGYVEGTPVGFALFFHNFSTFLGKPGLYLEDLFVYESHRGKGYGKALLLYLSKLAEERDCGRYEWMVLDWNETAIDFYNSLGAKQMKEWVLTRVQGEDIAKLAEKF